jgi:hypothetical protein
MKNLFQTLFGTTFQNVVDIVSQMDTIEKCLFLFWSICVVLFYSTFVYIIYLVGKDLVSKLVFTLKTSK